VSVETRIPLVVGPRALSQDAPRWLALALVLFLVAFPKGGVQLAGVPITWGYLLVGALGVICAVRLAAGASGRIGRLHLLALAALLPFQIVAMATFVGLGAESIGFTLSFLATFFFIPAVCLVATALYLPAIDVDELLRWLRNAVRFVAVYGIFLFFFRLTQGYFLEIPFLTVNLGDFGQLEDKYIDRGGVFKLISTYNNGNLYGICLLLLLPLYQWVERSRLAAGTVKFSLLLTLSRTVWAGLLVYELIYRLWLRRIGLRTVALLSASAAALALGIWWALRLMDLDLEFLFDAGLGNRLVQFQDSFAILPHKPFVGIAEMVYLSVLDTFGLVGLVAFGVALAAPVAMYFLRLAPGGTSDYRRSLVAGLLVYLFLASSDGAILLIPVMALYWFVAALLLTPGGPRSEGRATEAGRGAVAAAAGREVGPGGPPVTPEVLGPSTPR
jgi:hypothetical protein